MYGGTDLKIRLFCCICNILSGLPLRHSHAANVDSSSRGHSGSHLLEAGRTLTAAIRFQEKICWIDMPNSGGLQEFVFVS
jgi:hypothetical protein